VKPTLGKNLPAFSQHLAAFGGIWQPNAQSAHRAL